jgi:hypothetical protein
MTAPGEIWVPVDSQHASSARGLLKPALELYRLVPGEPPTTSEARLLWDIGEAVHRYTTSSSTAGCSAPADPGQETTPLAQGATRPPEAERVPG